MQTRSDSNIVRSLKGRFVSKAGPVAALEGIGIAPHGKLWTTWVWLGRTGLFARGVLFLINGWLILVAAWTSAQWSASFAHAFEAALGFPARRILVTLVALGMVALPLHSMGGARWIRMRSPVLIKPSAIEGA